MKIKTTALLLIILMGLFPFEPVFAGSPAEGSLDESLSMLYASRSILLDEVDVEEVNQAQDGLESVQQQEGNDAGEALGHLIHATKQQRNELNDSCRTLQAAYRAEGKTCELQILTDYCKAEEAKLNQRLGLLHRLRGDRRKFFTKLWHSVKRSGDRVWTAVGPVGRRILRNVGSEAAEVVLSGGTLGGGVIRKLVIREARNVGEAELNRLLERGVGRFMRSQAALAQAAGISDCTAEEMDEARRKVAGDVGDPEMEVDSDPDDCAVTGDEFEAFWEENIYPALVRESRNCSIGDVNVYKYCLREQMVNGEVCYPEAQLACQVEYRGIPENLNGAISLDIAHSEAEGVAASMLISGETDSVSGNFSYVMNDMNKCIINVTGSFQGVIDESLCRMSGNGMLTFIYNGVACPSVCGSGPNSEAACPVTLSGNATWEASMKNGELIGGMGCGDNSAPGCVGFSGGN